MKNKQEKIKTLELEIKDLHNFVGTIDEREVLKIIKERQKELEELKAL